jgi:predicted ABC-type ATPase
VNGTGLAWDWAPDEIVRAAWDAQLHPRGVHGKWATSGGKLPFSRTGGVANYHGSMGIDRADMPQLSGLVNGQYVPSAHMVPKFMAHLRAKGISVHEHRVPAASLKPTQTTGDIAAIRKIADNLKSGDLPDTKPITVSQDGRVLDGHHNWAGRALADSEGHKRDMRVVRVGLPMPELLKEARAFAKQEGIASRKTGDMANPKYATRAALALVDSPLGGGAARHPGDAGDPAAGRVTVARGLTWTGGEMLLRGKWDAELHPRGRHGEFEHAAGEAPAGPAGPSPVEVAKMVTDLQAQFAAERDKMRADQAAELNRVTAQLRAEQDRMTQLAGRTAEAKGGSGERRKEIVHAIVNILALVAVGALILATAGAALPPLAAAGVSVGPLIGGEALHVLRGRKPRAPGGAAAAVGASVKAQAAEEAKAQEATAKLLAKVTGADQQEAQRLAAQLIADAKAARKVSEGVTVKRAAWDPGLHPRDPHGEFAREAGTGVASVAAAATGAVKPLGGLVADSAGADSVAKYMNPDGTWNAQRAALHQKIVNETLAGVTPKGSPVATFLGGGSAAGKSTVLAGQSADTAHIDADAIKAKLPDYHEKLAAGDKGAAAYVHEESSYLAKAIAAEAAKRKMDYLVDGTGDGSINSMRKKIKQAKAAGHKTVGKYVTVATDEAVRRAQARAEKTGRMVPESVIRQIHAGVSDVFPKLIAEDAYDAAELWDTGGAKPLLVGRKPEGGKWKVADQAAWERFLAKAHEI